MADLLVLPLHHLADERLHTRLHLVFAPQLQDPLIALLLRIISHSQRGLVWVVRVERVTQEIQPFHHHELHRFVELGRVGEALVRLHTLPGSLTSSHQQVRQLFDAALATGLRPTRFLHVAVGTRVERRVCKAFRVNGVHVDLLEGVEQFLKQVTHVLVLPDPHFLLLVQASLNGVETGIVHGCRLDQNALPVLVLVLQVVDFDLQLLQVRFVLPKVVAAN